MERYYRPELDVLRCFAFLMVFASHTVPGSTAVGGAFGVDLFFTLSSFLITTLLLRESSVCGALDVTAFYLRRVLRILPLYFGFLLAATTLARSLVPDENLPLKYVVAFALLCGNWACVLWGYPHSVATPLWSVSIEEQFYLCWPLIMRRWVHRLTMVAVGLVVVSFVTRLCLVLHGAIHPQIWCNTLARLDPIACGALLAVRQDKREITLSPGIRVALLLGGCGVLTAAGRFGDVVGIKALVTFPAVTAACVALLVAALSLQMAPGRGPAVRALVYLGRISYGLYVFHSLFIRAFGVPSTHAPLARLMRAMAALLATIVSLRRFPIIGSRDRSCGSRRVSRTSVRARSESRTRESPWALCRWYNDQFVSHKRADCGIPPTDMPHCQSRVDGAGEIEVSVSGAARC